MLGRVLVSLLIRICFKHHIRYSGPMSLAHTIQTREGDWLAFEATSWKWWECVMLSWPCPLSQYTNWDGLKPMQSGHWTWVMTVPSTPRETKATLTLQQAKYKSHCLWVTMNPLSVLFSRVEPICLLATRILVHGRIFQRSDCSCRRKILVFLSFITWELAW